MNEQPSIVGVREGDIIAAKYRIEQVLGSGGMGVVVAARHLELDERVAIKFLLPQALANAEVVARFSREARAAVRIKNEHVARILDVGRLENGVPYIIMEHLEGSDLASWLEKRGALPLDQALDFILQACEAIAAAHALGIVHRDIKPANLFVVRLGDGSRSIKVLDFGISKVDTPSDSNPTITHTSTLLGSPLYMPPEQMRSARSADARSDIWSLGVLLHELIAGAPPFLGVTMGEVLTQVLEASPPNLTTLVPAVPPGLAAVVQRCLQKDPLFRYRDVAELARALSPFAPLRSQTSVVRIARVLQGAGRETTGDDAPSGPASSERLPVAGTGASWGGTHFGAAKTGRWRWLVAGAGILAGALAALFLWPRSSSVTPAESPSAAWSTSATQPPPAAAPLPAPVISPVPPPATSGNMASGDANARASASRVVRAERPGKNVRPSAGSASARPQPEPAAPSIPKPSSHATDPFEDR